MYGAFRSSHNSAPEQEGKRRKISSFRNSNTVVKKLLLQWTFRLAFAWNFYMGNLINLTKKHLHRATVHLTDYHWLWNFSCHHQDFHPCPIHRNWVDSSKALDNSTRFERYVPTWFAQSLCLTNRLPAWQIDHRGNNSCRFDRIESTTFSTHPASITGTFLVLKTWPQTSVDLYDSCRFDQIDLNRQHFQPTLKVQINYME